ncbi:MAG: hypothetical protein J0I92_10170 [Phyllobacterium sp.]|nr:hypothetical protein [Phyllobacterium sp.]
MPTDHVRRIQTLRPDELEQFIDHWVSHKAKAYADTQVWAGSGDKGRNVVGFLSPERFEGPWHLFQAKQLRSALRMPDILPELAKVFFAFRCLASGAWLQGYSCRECPLQFPSR